MCTALNTASPTWVSQVGSTKHHTQQSCLRRLAKRAAGCWAYVTVSTTPSVNSAFQSRDENFKVAAQDRTICINRILCILNTWCLLKKTPTPHIPQWDYERQDKSVLQLSPPIALRHVSSPETTKQWNRRTHTRKRKGCLATYSICLWTLLQSHLLGGFGNVAEHGEVGGIHALSSSRQEHSYLKL